MAPTATLARHGIVSIGYEGQNIVGLVESLAGLGVGTLADVRLNAISRKPGFSKIMLTKLLNEAGIQYLHLRTLGNPKSNRASFHEGQLDVGRQVFLESIKNFDAKKSLNELSVLSRNQLVAVMCFESEHDHCHRKVVIDEVIDLFPVPVHFFGQ
jgi:uncharacterized protein (DUF488 family)